MSFFVSAHKDKEKIKFLKRKELLNKRFVWTKEAVQNILSLNVELKDMQGKLEQQIRFAYELFTKLEKNGMSFLHGFKVLGWIDFEKEILKELYKLEKTTKEQKKIMKKWEYLEIFSRDEIEAWHLVFDSDTADFLPLSKIRQKQKGKCWDFIFPDNENIDFYSFLEDFIDYNTVFSYQDFAELIIKDFTPVVKVILNYNISEMEPFFTTYPRGVCQDNIYDILKDRKNALDRAFSWNDENINKIIEVNSCIWKRHNELIRYITELNSVFNIFSQTDPEFKNYIIEGQIEYHGRKANDIATLEMQKEMSRYAAFHYWTLGVDDEQQEIYDSSHEDPNLNWNVEVYSHHLSEEQKRVRFHHLMHALFVDDHIYSFEDLVRMHEEDFKVCLEIEWKPD